jgi:hypothetical protein
MKTVYLGDGAYARYDGFNVWLTTSDGVTTTNEVCLEPEVLQQFKEFLESEVNGGRK